MTTDSPGASSHDNYYDTALLPRADTSMRCAAHAEKIGLDPGGSALWVDELIVVDVPLPWPKPVWAADNFTAVPELVMEAGVAGRRVRVLAAVPLDDGVHRIVTHVRGDRGPLSRREHQADRLEIPALLRRLLIDGPRAVPASLVDVEPPPRELLLCTQGSHDICCGSRGTALAAELAVTHPDLLIRRVSHTGGHRMAPTGVTLPDGRMWGMIDAREMGEILCRTGSPARLARRCRGWTGAAEGPAQMAERAVFAALDDWTFDDEPRSVEVTSADGEVTELRVEAARGAWTVLVGPGRAVPTIACGEPGGLPAKPGAEWVVLDIQAD